MLLSTSSFRLDFDTPVNFLLECKSVDVFVEAPKGQIFWMFAKEREADTVKVWAFGLSVLMCLKPRQELHA